MDFGHLKTILAFLVTSILLVALFDVVAYTGVHDYSHYKDLIHLQEHNEHLLNTFDDGKPVEAQFARFTASHPNGNHQVAILDKQGNLVSGAPKNDLMGIPLNEIITALGDKAHLQQKTSLADKELLWVANRIPRTPYILLTTLTDSHDEITSQAFYDFVGLPLTITAFFGIWISLWTGVALLKRIQKHQQIARHKATYDNVTQLPNSTSLLKTIEETLKNNPGEHALCIISLQRFREINDSLGHDDGDEVLRQVGARLKAASRATDTVARFGGKKFAIFLANSNANAMDIVSQKLLSALDPAFEISSHRLYIRGTLGMAISPDHAKDAKTLIHKADMAIQQAQNLSKDVAIYDPDNDNNNAERLDLANDLRNAIHEDTLQLYYQPQLHLGSNKIVGAEALCRWIHPKQGFIPPDVFIEIAERTGLIKPLTEWVIKTAIKQCAVWHRAGKHLHVSINLSARSLHEDELIKYIEKSLNDYQLAPNHIILEITETAMMLNPDNAKVLLQRLNDFGLRISIDDFGTGYSSLSYLKQLPIEEIKIDRSFVMNMASDENDASIVKATVGLAHDLGLKVVAEGIEDDETLGRLQALTCDLAQGYHISRPQPANDFMMVLQQWDTPTPSAVADDSNTAKNGDAKADNSFNPAFKPA
jgi:diguanylate cyclase (GGDEF)-like protein